MNILTTLGSFAVVGVVVSAVIEYTKGFFTKATQGERMAYMIGLSIVGGLVVYFWHMVPTDYVTTAVGVIAAVNTAYTFLVQFLPNWGPATPATTTVA